MSLLRRVQQIEEVFDDENELASPLQQVTSAWSAWTEIRLNCVFKPLAQNVHLSADPHYPSGAWGVVGTNGVLYVNPLKTASLAEWQFVLAHLLAHLGLRHSATADPLWHTVYEYAVNALLAQLEIGKAPIGFLMPTSEIGLCTDAETLYAVWKRKDPSFDGWTSAGGFLSPDIVQVGEEVRPADKWAMLLTQGLLENIGGTGKLTPWVTVGNSRAKQALAWFADEFPLLSALAAHFTIIEERSTIAAYQINVAAVNAQRMEIYVNPDVDLTLGELKFIIGHELMHVGLLHHKRLEDRDPYLWNVACDFVINAWLIEMGVGEMPPRGGLYDAKFAGLSSNEIYDLLLKDPDYAKRLITFRGIGLGDILPPEMSGNPRLINGHPIEDIADVLMKQGIKKHMDGKRGLLPSGLLEMITPTPTAPPKWKLSLTRWFDSHFEKLAPARTYARLSRRQQATPEIPRPRFAVPQLPDGSSIFGVLLDTSGSMSNQLLSQCLGAIVSLAHKHNIKQVRLMFCDAAPYDEGFVPIKRLMEPVHVKGRGGTRLQPGIELFDKAKDFPADAPVLIITDGGCDKLTITREHAFLLPEGNKLPFIPIGPVFELK